MPILCDRLLTGVHDIDSTVPKHFVSGYFFEKSNWHYGNVSANFVHWHVFFLLVPIFITLQRREIGMNTFAENLK